MTRALTLALTALLPVAVAAAEPPATTRPAPPPELSELGASSPRVRAWQAHAEQAEARRQEVEGRIAALRRELDAVTSGGATTPQTLRAAMTTLSAEQLKLEVDQVGLSARRDALADAVSKLSEATEKRVAAQSTEVIKALEAELQLRTHELDRTKQLVQAGVSTPTELTQVQATVEQVRAQLGQERASFKKSPEFETLSALNRQLIDSSVSLAETVARLDFVSKRLQALSKTQPAVEQLESLERARLRVEDEVDRLRSGAGGAP